MRNFVSAAALLVIAVCLALCGGCGPKPVVGGVNGTLLASGKPISEMQVTVHRQSADGWHPIGFGDTDSEGNFALVQPGAIGPLTLEPGEHRFTLESIGVPVQIPKAYRKAETTPLRVVWPTPQQTLDLDAAIKVRSR